MSTVRLSVPQWRSDTDNDDPNSLRARTRSRSRSARTQSVAAPVINIAKYLSEVERLSTKLADASGRRAVQSEIYQQRALVHRRAGSWYAATSDYTMARALLLKTKDPGEEKNTKAPAASPVAKPAPVDPWVPFGARPGVTGNRRIQQNATSLSARLSEMTSEQRRQVMIAAIGFGIAPGDGEGTTQRSGPAATLLAKLLGGGAVTVC